MSGSLGFDELLPFLETLKSPRIIFIMIKTGEVVDQLLDSLKPFLDKGDIIIEGGNSHYTDTIRRFEDFSQEGIYFLGTGISGGEQGALKGPSIMAGGSKEGFEKVVVILNAINLLLQMNDLKQASFIYQRKSSLGRALIHWLKLTRLHESLIIIRGKAFITNGWDKLKIIEKSFPLA